MTAAPPNDSGAAASRDAARSARRLTDGSLPRRPPTPDAPLPPPTPAEPVREHAAEPVSEPVREPAADPAASAPKADAADGARPTASTPTVATRETPTVAARETPAAAAPSPPVAAPPSRPSPPGDAPAGTAARPAPSAAAAAPPPGAPAPARTGPPPIATSPPPAAAGPATAAPTAPPTGASPWPAAGPAAGASAAPASRPAGPLGGASPESGSRATDPPAVTSPAQASRPTAPSPVNTTGPLRPSAAAVGGAAGARPVPVAADGPGPASAPSGTTVDGPRPASAPVGTAAAQAPASAPAASPADRPVLPVRTPVGSASAARVAGAGPAVGRPTTGPADGGPAPATSPARATAPATAPAPARAEPAAAPVAGKSLAPAPGSSDLPGVPEVGVFKEERDLLDFGRITGMRVASVATPVAAVGRLPRRKNVIGTETTGSIPVHLLFRDGGGAAGPVAAGADDGGPDTVAMAPPAGRKARAVIPRPAARQPHAASARPAPTADPGLVERPAAVLPGWVGVAGGLLALLGCAAVVWWAGAVPDEAARMLRLPPRPYHGIHLAQWALLALGVLVLIFAVGGLGRGRVGYAWVLTLFGEYRGTVRRTGLVWASPLLLRRRVDVRLRHWRSEPLPAVDAKGTALDVTVLVVWRVRDTVRAALGVDGHEDYLREQVEAAMARVLSQLPADAFHEDAPTLRDAEAVGEALTRMLSAECAPVGLDVFSAQPTRIEYAPEVAEAMRRRRIAAIDAKHRDSVLTSVVDAVDDVVHRLTSRGLVELDDYERKALVKDLTVAFYTGRGGPGEGA
ncbi:SPFH domain-containing protein [Streptomyces hydrogenans]|uniref:SPFH domain-containing protein n=1 Tax=Streptomyces hydrogenans TaxID=1873719 RepID=UPI0036643CE9